MNYQLPSGIGTIAIKQEIKDPSKPTIVFLHDSIGCIKLWRDFPEKLADQSGCNYLVYDRIGFGQSSRYTDLPHRGNQYHEIEAAILIDLLKDLEVPHPILFGHSDGGTIALLAAAKEPSLIKGLLTEGAHVFVEAITIKGIREAKDNYTQSNLREKLYKYHEEKVDEVVYAWTDVWLHESFRDWNIEKFLPNITCPCLIIQGDKDEYGTLKQVDSIISQVTGKATKLILPNVGHTPHREDTLPTLAHSAKFIREM